MSFFDGLGKGLNDFADGINRGVADLRSGGAPFGQLPLERLAQLVPALAGRGLAPPQTFTLAEGTAVTRYASVDGAVTVDVGLVGEPVLARCGSPSGVLIEIAGGLQSSRDLDGSAYDAALLGSGAAGHAVCVGARADTVARVDVWAPGPPEELETAAWSVLWVAMGLG